MSLSMCSEKYGTLKAHLRDAGNVENKSEQGQGWGGSAFGVRVQ